MHIFDEQTKVINDVSNPVPIAAETLESLVDTLQELCQRLAPLGSAINIAGGNGLRVVGVGGSYGVTGPLTSAQYTASNLTSRLAVENQTAVFANINNCVGAQ
jgi:hypothetical protein